MKYPTISLSLIFFFGAQGMIYYIAIAMVIFSHVVVVAYTGKLHPKGVSFSGFRYMKW